MNDWELNLALLTVTIKIRVIFFWKKTYLQIFRIDNNIFHGATYPEDSVCIHGATFCEANEPQQLVAIKQGLSRDASDSISNEVLKTKVVQVKPVNAESKCAAAYLAEESDDSNYSSKVMA